MTHKVIKTLSNILSFILFAIALWGCSETVIEINGQKVKKKVYDNEVRERELIHKGKPIPVNPALIKQTAVTAIIRRTIILQEAEKDGITITKEELNERWRDFTKRFKDEDQFQEYLDERNVSKKFVKKRIREIIISDKFYKHIYDNVVVTDEEVQKYYVERNWKKFGPVLMRASYIRTSTREKAEQLLSEIKRLGSYHRALVRAVKQNEEGVETRKPFWINPDEPGGYDKEIVREADKIITGRHEGPIKISDKWYIIRVYERKTELIGFEDAKEEIRQDMRKKRANEKLEKLLQERIASSDVKVYSDRM